MAMRSALHHAGATALGELLQFPVPADAERSIACHCRHQAGYQDLRSKPVLTAVGKVTVKRPYYLCTHCHRGQFPADVELDIENTETSLAHAYARARANQGAPGVDGQTFEQIESARSEEWLTGIRQELCDTVSEPVADGMEARSRSLATFFYCSRVGRAGRGVQLRVGNIRISFRASLESALVRLKE